MEGKAVLFKRFADVDSIDLEVETEDPDEFINAVKYLGPSFGGINLEDIKAPECFYHRGAPARDDGHPGLPRRPARHRHHRRRRHDQRDPPHRPRREDDAARLQRRRRGGHRLPRPDQGDGLRAPNVILCDTKGVVYRGRHEGMNQWKSAHAVETPLRTLEEAMVGADIFFGLSAKGALTPEMVKTMAPNPIIFAMANPDPEITPEDAQKARDDVIIATGRSDYPNQVNNVLGFPYIFRGALDVRAKTINMEMKIAATRALAELAREDVPDEVASAYRGSRPRFGRDYIIPGPVRPAADPCRADRGREGGDGIRRRAASDRRSRRLQGAAVGPARPDRGRHAAHHRSRAADAEAGRLRRGRGGAGHPRRLLVRQPGARHGDPGRPRGSGAGGRARRPGSISPTRASRSTTRGFRTATRATRSSSTRSCSARATCLRDCQRLINQDRNYFAAAMVARGRRRRDGDRRHAQFLDRARGGPARDRRQARPSRRRRLDHHLARAPDPGRRHRHHRDAERGGPRRDRDRGGRRRAAARLRAARGDARVLQLRASGRRARTARPGGGAHSRFAEGRFRVRRRDGRRRRPEQGADGGLSVLPADGHRERPRHAGVPLRRHLDPDAAGARRRDGPRAADRRPREVGADRLPRRQGFGHRQHGGAGELQHRRVSRSAAGRRLPYPTGTVVVSGLRNVLR